MLMDNGSISDSDSILENGRTYQAYGEDKYFLPNDAVRNMLKIYSWLNRKSYQRLRDTGYIARAVPT
jgi:hypothetical protein